MLLAPREQRARDEAERGESLDELMLRLQAEEEHKTDGMAEVTQKSIYTCPKCHGRNMRQRGQQTRSADEPETQFATCLNKECELFGVEKRRG